MSKIIVYYNEEKYIHKTGLEPATADIRFLVKKNGEKVINESPDSSDLISELSDTTIQSRDQRSI